MVDRFRGSRHLQLLMLVVVAGAIVRFATLGSQSIWTDEALTASYSAGSLKGLLTVLPASDANPPLFYILEWVFVRIFGSGDSGLRTLSAVSGMLTPLVLYAIATRVASRRAGLMAAVLGAFEPMLWWYSQEARPYALFGLLSALGLLAFVVALENRSSRAIALWAICGGLLLTTQYFSIFQLAPEAAWMLLSLRGRRREVLLALAGLGVVAISLSVPFALQLSHPGFSKLPLRPRVEVIVPQLLASPSPPAKALWISALALVIGGIALALVAPAQRQRYFARVLAALLAWEFLVPILAALAGSDFIVTRNLIATLIPAVVLVGIGFGSSRVPKGAGITLAGTAAVLWLAVVIAISADPGLQRIDTKAAVASLGPVTRGRVILSPGNYLFTFTLPRYVKGGFGFSELRVPIEEVDVLVPHAGADDWPASLCLAGQTCQLFATHERIAPPAPGFYLFSRKEIEPFTVWRWRARSPRLLNFRDLAAYAPMAPGSPPFALYQPFPS